MLKFIKRHKIIFLIVMLALGGGSYFGYGKLKGADVQASYVTSPVIKGTLVASVSSIGQVSASNQVEIKSKVSGEISKIAAVNGQEVKAGQTIAQIDASDAYKAVRDASASLASAQLSMDKLKQAADANSVLQAENSVAIAQNSLDKLKLSQPMDYQNALADLQSAQNSLAKAYSDAFTAISNSFLNLPNIISALNDILTSDQISASDNSLGKGQLNISALYNTTYETDKVKIKSYQLIAENDYAAARQAYDANYSNFKNATVYSDTSTIENLLAETLATSKAIAQAIKSENNYLAVWSDARSLRNMSIFAMVSTYKTNLNTYSGQANTSISNLANAEADIQADKDGITEASDNIKILAQNQPLDLTAAENSLKEKQAALVELKAGADSFDIKTQELSLQQKRNSLYDAQTALADYTIKAPFDGVIAAVNLKVGDSAGSTAIATIVTKQQIAEISLNEVDAAKIEVGQKATMTFDAIDGLAITGKVAELDTIGAVSQGVVTYNLKIVFDTQDIRVKPGMSANAAIIIDSKIDVLSIDSSAVKTDLNGGNYIQTLNADGQPLNRAVQIGLANDTHTEIISGLSEGEEAITQTINSGAAKTTTGAAQRSSNVGGFIMSGSGPR